MTSRVVLGYVALVSSVVVAVAAAVWLKAASEGDSVLIVSSVAVPPVIVAVLGPRFRIEWLLAAASVAYTVWFCLAARADEEIALDNPLGALRLWSVKVAWAVAAVLVFAASVSAVQAAMRRRARRLERRDQGMG